MQPNQQDPNIPPEVPQQPAPASAPTPAQQVPFQVPEYLDLGPIADPVAAAEKKRKKSAVFLFLVILFVVFVLCGVAIYLYVQHNAPQEKFYRAFEDQMKINYIAEDLSITSKTQEDKTTLTAVSRSDFSDVKKPKTSLSYVTKNGNEKAAGGEVINIENVSRYASVSVENELSKELKLSTKTWYRAPEKGRVFNRVFDSNLLGEQLNAPVGLLVVGNYSAQVRKDLANALKEDRAFDVKNIKDDGENTQVYTVAVDTGKVYDAYVKFADKQDVGMISRDRHLSIANVSGDVKLWFNSKEHRFTKAAYTIKFVSSKLTADVETSLSYPSRVDISAPSSIQELKVPGRAN